MFAPFGEGPVNHTTPWRSEPPYRGTYGILSTCLVTMGLCIWTALHLNMQEHNGFYRQIWRKVGWLTIGLFAPEMVAWTAFQQHRDAQRLDKKMSGVSKLKRLERSPTSTLEEDPHTKTGAEVVSVTSHWTSVHSHYALMGGFAFEPRQFGKSFLPGNLIRLTLTLTAVEFLAINEPELLPKISEEDIRDKSKANALAKTLVCLQAIWFCFQCVTRVQQGLAITLLELNTFAHAICTLLIYLLWWNKPLDIEQPTIIRGEHADIICAMMVMLDGINQGRQKFYGVGFGSIGSGSLEYVPSEVAALPEPPVELDEEGWLRYFTSNLPSAPTEGEELGPAEGEEVSAPIEDGKSSLQEAAICMENLAAYSSHKSITYRSTTSNAGPLTLYPYLRKPVKLMYGGEPYRRFAQSDFYFPGIFGFKWTLRFNLKRQPHPPCLKLSLRDIICSRLAADGMRRYHSLTSSEQSDEGELGAWERDRDGRRYLNLRNGDWPALGYVDQQGLHLESKSILTAFICAGLIYGALHLFAWNAIFPSELEKTLWRSSGVTLAISGAILTVQYITPTNTNSFFCDMAAGMSVALMMFLAVLYVAARVYLVVECFLNLKYLPEAAYVLPKWSRYFPHIT